jgi:hypothetical protein
MVGIFLCPKIYGREACAALDAASPRRGANNKKDFIEI